MTQQGYRHRILVIDRSGSIDAILAGQQQGLDEFLASEAAQDGKVTVSLWDFDTEILARHSFGDPRDVLEYRIVPRGGTALFDAVGQAVITEGQILAAMPEDQRPEDVVLVISTDGQENSSHQFSGEKVKSMLGVQQDAYQWRVLFMGAGLEAFEQHAAIGVASGQSVNYVSSNTGSLNAWRGTKQYLSRTPYAASAAAAGQSVNFSRAERDLAESGEEQPDNGKDTKKGAKKSR